MSGAGGYRGPMAADMDAADPYDTAERRALVGAMLGRLCDALEAAREVPVAGDGDMAGRIVRLNRFLDGMPDYREDELPGPWWLEWCPIPAGGGNRAP